MSQHPPCPVCARRMTVHVRLTSEGGYRDVPICESCETKAKLNPKFCEWRDDQLSRVRR